MIYLYILKSLIFSKTYVGITEDLDRRLKEHNSDQSIFTKRYNPWKVIHREEFQNIKEARQ